MTILWIIIISVSIYGWLVVYSLYLELSDLTKLEDLAHLRVRRSFHGMLARSFIENRLSRPLDGNHAVVERICHAFACWITTDDTTLHGFYDARLVHSLTLRESTKMFRSFCTENLKKFFLNEKNEENFHSVRLFYR
jgi:hypothetical protein